MSLPHVMIITGLSGSGKSVAIKCFEDMGFFCVDNLPTELVPKFVDLCAQSDKKISRVALGLDIREKDFYSNFSRVCDDIKASGSELEVLFFDSSDEVLARRFSETRRPHPVNKSKPLLDSIKLERGLLEDVRLKADRIIDTSNLTVHQLKAELSNHYRPKGEEQKMMVSVMSFGFKYGVPFDADLVFDVRFLPNPNFVPALKELTGRQKSVQEYVKKNGLSTAFLKKIMSLMDFLLPLYIKDGKNYLTIAIGCTGGRHRSVAVSEFLRDKLADKGVELIVRHRDIER